LQTFNQQFEAVVQRFPERTAFRLKTPQGYTTVSYLEAYRQAKGVALGLLALGMNRGSRIAILSENRPEWVVAYLGIYLSGMVAVPLDTQISPAEWRRLIDDSESQTVFVSGLLMPKLREAIQGSRLQQVISLDSIAGNQDTPKDLSGLIHWTCSPA
jgi:long-chain acyl-CoA synthetase